MTIFKNVKLEANAAAQLAIALIEGKDPSSAGLTLSDFTTRSSPSHKIQALLLPAQVITQANVEDVDQGRGADRGRRSARASPPQCTTLGIK